MIPIISDRENKDMIKCSRGDRVSCPGHGPSKLKCVYTTPFPEGHWIPCRNLDDSDVRCEHNLRCRRICVGEDSEEIGKKRQIDYKEKKEQKKLKEEISEIECEEE
jgi:hypothetical protein